MTGHIRGDARKKNAPAAAAVGRCGHSLGRCGDTPLTVCALPFGHRGWHEAEGGAPQWGIPWSTLEQAAEQRLSEVQAELDETRRHIASLEQFKHRVEVAEARLAEAEQAAEQRGAERVLAEFTKWVATNRAYNGSPHQRGQSLYDECLNDVLGEWAIDFAAQQRDWGGSDGE